jgi:hypothetical protein
MVNQLAHKLVIQEEGSHIAQSILEGDAIAVSDGSFKNSVGTAAWIIQSSEGESAMEGRAICPGIDADQSSYQSELNGILLITQIVNKVCKFCKIEEGGVTIGCDGLSALTASCSDDLALNPERSNFEVENQAYTRPPR